MTAKAAREATVAVMDWIAERHGEKVAEWWFWDCTPMPCWLPSEQQIEEGFQFALGRWSVRQFSERINGRQEYEYRMLAKAERKREGA